jgi:uncharacterized protein (DUF1697 family)
MIYAVLFRGVNVGGRNRLPMKELVRLLTDLGYRDVTTYIQSGNVVLDADDAHGSALGDREAIADRIAAAVESRFGFAPALVLVTLKELETVVTDNPFPQAEAAPKTLHVAFLGGTPDTGKLDRLASFAAPTEQWRLAGRILYFWAPQGFGTSKFPAAAERLLAVPATYRNWQTVVAMLDLAR